MPEWVRRHSTLQRQLHYEFVLGETKQPKQLRQSQVQHQLFQEDPVARNALTPKFDLHVILLRFAENALDAPNAALPLR